MLHLPREVEGPRGQRLPYVSSVAPMMHHVSYSISHCSIEEGEPLKKYRTCEAIVGEAGGVGVPDGELEDQSLTSPTEALL